jgi:hypothetical protein
MGLREDMADITREEMRADMRVAFKEVLTDRDLLEHVFEPFISRIVIEKMTDKFERTLGVDCTDHDSREETRKDMEFLRKTRQWAQTDEGSASVATFKRLMKVVDFAASSAVRGIVYLLLAGSLFLITVGAATHKNVRQLLGF